MNSQPGASGAGADVRRIGLSLGADICWPLCHEGILRRLSRAAAGVDRSGAYLMHLQLAVEPNECFVRCLGVGPQVRLVRWSLFCAATRRPMRLNLDWKPFFEAVRLKVAALYPAHEVHAFTELSWSRIQRWRESPEAGAPAGHGQEPAA